MVNFKPGKYLRKIWCYKSKTRLDLKVIDNTGYIYFWILK